MSLKALQDYTFYSKNSRYDANKKRRETWAEAVQRVKEMHLRRYPQAAHDIEWAFNQVLAKRVLGSQRALQYGGKPIEDKHTRIYNCSSSYCDRVRFFQEAFWLLLCGCGVGFSVQRHHVAKLPWLVNPNDSQSSTTHVVADTIEGWADALGVLLASYMWHPEFAGLYRMKVNFDFSKIRPEGSPLSSGVGKAPGSKPLERSLGKIRELLDRIVVEDKRDRLKPIDAYDILMHASDAVLSGGVRRSATICLFSQDDEEMLNAKTGNWFITNPQRGRSNNSVVLLRNLTSFEQFESLVAATRQFGEPGFYFTDNTEEVPNPCVEIGLFPFDEKTGQSGWQMCNLCEINGRKVRTINDFRIAARAAAIIGTLQAGYTDFGYLGEASERITRREALLGVSITGMMDNPHIIFDELIQREMAQLVVKTNEEIAKLIGINPAARATCVKPAGTTSCLLGTSSGIHPHHAKRYFRRVQANHNEEVLKYFEMWNPSAVKPSAWSASGTDKVITFCVEVPDTAKTKNDLSAIELLRHVKLTQDNWVQAGKVVDRCVSKTASHNVSHTVNVNEDEWDEVIKFIYDNRHSFSGVCLLPSSGDLDYTQAPMCNVLTPAEILEKYGDGSLMASGLIVDGLHAFGDLWVACEYAMGFRNIGYIEKVKLPSFWVKALHAIGFVQRLEDWSKNATEVKKKLAQVDWVRRVKQFADRYCNGDVRQCTYLLKHVNNWKEWVDLNREYKDVDYTAFVEEKDNTTIQETIACAGGKCDF